MKQLQLIIQREYWTRVRRRSFIIATLLTPLAFGLFIAVVSYIFSYKSDEAFRIAVIDEGELFEGGIADEPNIFFKMVRSDLETLKGNFKELGYHGILVTPKAGQIQQKNYKVNYYTDQKLTLELEPVLENRIHDALRKYKITELQLDERSLKALDSEVEINPKSISDDVVVGTSMAGEAAAIIGMIMAFFMYITVFVYGMMVMRSVMEEKTNRIVEVMISSVRPFPLMLGKIIGVGLVGLTQVLAWAVLIPAMVFIVSIIFGFQVDAAAMGTPPPEMAKMNEHFINLLILELQALNWWSILPLFLLYFLGGYFMYAALFAAVGSAMGDDLGEGQALTIPITIPVILAFYITIAAIQSPNSSMAIWASFFPLFSPIVMPSRLPFDPPVWQIIGSLLLLIASCLALIWLSGRIYRVGILLYGKKVTLWEMGKWLFRK